MRIKLFIIAFVFVFGLASIGLHSASGDGCNVLELGAGPGWTLTDWIAQAAHTGKEIDAQIGVYERKKWMHHNFKIMRGMITHPCTTSAVIESSPWVALEMINHFDKKRVDRFDIVECNPRFFKNMERRYGVRREAGHLNNVYLYNQYFDKSWKPQGMRKFIGQYDVIIATLPFTQLPNEAIQEILDRSLQLLKPGGKFMCIHLLFSRTITKIMACIEELWDYHANEPATQNCKKKLALLDDWFSDNFELSTTLVKMNFIPPMWVHVGTKR